MSQTVFKGVPATDPAATAALWARVRSAMSPITRVMVNSEDNNRGAGGRGGRRGRRGRGGDHSRRKQVDVGQHESKKRKRNVQQDESENELASIAVSQSAALMANNIIQTKIMAQSGLLEDFVLRPRRIVKGRDEFRKNAYSHFGTAPPPGGDYTAIDGLDATQIWLSLSNDQVEEIIEEYRCMKYRRLCEAEYAFFATETFLRRQRRFLQTPTDRKWRAERMIQLFAPPTEWSYWIAPPSFEKCPEFKFDLRPDCCYWLSLAGFNSVYRSELRDAVYIQDEDWITCPYFTIEFKKHGQSIEQATRQACAAASIPLYNRYRLKQEALEVETKEWTDSDRAEMKHYILTFVGTQYDIWVLRARFSEDSSTWDGCSMVNICKSSCTSSVGVRRLESWINEIHRWGLSRHAAGCQTDAKTILNDNEIDTSMID
ncbi:uncharacterized protein Z518_03208 [Rhinocladiella mackenziei CBS 650.93]|uniref:Rhinocladiella mackenziei CBS 650.93 unplaced genomic scaffold supercont1.2, whole genome shotgun sequence n=1 Tax=Rhinocladiella mackenziei CBS 650.93 TaxID=1442369 RepID=A0A0D2G245_9EURO|nr:uncharacterized protein Z518_03208 [Rhinocladiella mackenziei CBS 650.93]KIX08552.1 hypothetical protein Z518_03208 [Rhinocladiella mackenziei CBS 650.93]